MQGEHWILIANACEIMYFADSVGRKKYSFLKQQYEQMMPEPLQTHPSFCGFYTIYEAFLLFKLRQEEITGVHAVNVLSLISNYMYFLHVYMYITLFYMYFFIFSNVNVQVIYVFASNQTL